MSTAADEALVDQAQQGDGKALSDLLCRYERKTYTLAYRLMGNHADASDAAQEALVRVYTRLHKFRGDSAFSTWLFRVVTNTCLDELRRRGRYRQATLETATWLEDSLSDHQPEPGGNPVETAERREVQAAMQRAIARLPKEYRVVVVLRDLREYSYQEIAAALGTSVGTVKSRLHRARQALRMVVRATESKRLEIGRIAG